MSGRKCSPQTQTKDPETACHILVHNVERGGQKVEIKTTDLEEQTITRVEVPHRPKTDNKAHFS